MEKKQKNIEKTNLLVLSFIVLASIFFITLVIATPTGPSAINITSNETIVATAGTLINISGGYLSKLNLTATTQNPHWKAFAGWIDGRFTLDDASGSTIYDWSLTSVGGEVYATRTASTVTWASIGCANSTQINSEDTILQQTGGDNISSTFSGSNLATFLVAGTTISATACSATNTYVNNATSSNFEEVILHDTTNLVFATILETDLTGYDGNTYDFQMIVPENGSATWTGTTAYYLYVELS